MSDYSNMTSSEKLIALIDGELPSEETTTLFYELAQNVELQEEMREQLAMRQLLTTKPLIPPDHLKHKILLSTGLGSFLSIASAKLSSSALGLIGLSALRSKAFLMLSSALIGSLFTLYFTHNPQENTKVSIEETPPIVHLFEIEEPQSYHLENNQLKENNKNSNTESKISTVVPAQAIPNDELSIDKSADESVPIYNAIEISSVDHLQGNFNQQLEREFLINETQEYKFDEPIFPEFYEQLSLQIRGFTTRSIPELNIPPLDNPVMNNMAIGLFYKFDKSMQVGIEVGQENFMQEYHQYELGSLKRDIKQNYTAFWTGVSFQYNIAEYGHTQKLYPFTRVFLGGTNIGPLLRGMIGIQFDYENSFSLFTGIESTSLFYRYSGNTFSTYKLGLTFGGSVNF